MKLQQTLITAAVVLSSGFALAEENMGEDLQLDLDGLHEVLDETGFLDDLNKLKNTVAAQTCPLADDQKDEIMGLIGDAESLYEHMKENASDLGETLLDLDKALEDQEACSPEDDTQK